MPRLKISERDSMLVSVWLRGVTNCALKWFGDFESMSEEELTESIFASEAGRWGGETEEKKGDWSKGGLGVFGPEHLWG